MNELFVICNQLGQYWGKKKRWVDGRKRRKVMTFKHRDEGLNQLVELSARDTELRGEVIAVEVDDRGVPRVRASEHRIVDEEDMQAEAAAAESTDEAGEEADEDRGEAPTEEPCEEAGEQPLA